MADEVASLKVVIEAEDKATESIEKVKSSLSDLTQASAEIDGKQCTITVDANGNIEILDEAGNKMSYLEGTSGVSLAVDADGNIEILDEAGTKVAEIDGKTGTVNLIADDNVSPVAEGALNVVSQIPEMHQTTFSADDNITPTANNAQSAANAVPTMHNTSFTASDGVTSSANSASGATNAVPLTHHTSLTCSDGVTGPASSAAAAVNSIPSSKTVTISFQTSGASNFNSMYTAGQFAKGTQNFGGGLAMVNDEKGISDPRELIDTGKITFMFEEKNVITNLPPHAKIYTAAQTKSILKNIPHFASGNVDNEEFKTYKADFTHRKNTSNMSIEDQIEEWKNALSLFAYDSEVVNECNEEIFKLTRKLVDSLNDLSDIYIDDRTYLNDWGTWEDDAISAFSRVRDTNFEFLQEGTITWDEYFENVMSAGKNLYEGRINQSQKWLTQQLKYNDMSYSDYIQGLNRMKDYTEEYYNQGMISYQMYADNILEINNKIADYTAKLNSQIYKNWQNDADSWYKLREGFDDWEQYGDSKTQFYEREKERIKGFLEGGIIDFEEYVKQMNNISLKLASSQKNTADNIYNTWKDSSDNWKKLRNTYDDWEVYGDNLVDYYKRCIDKVNAMYKAGLITWQDMRDEIMNYQMNLYKAQQDEINDFYSQKISSLQETWEVGDRQSDIEDASEKINIFENAVTQKGKDKLSDYKNELVKLQREEEIYQLNKDKAQALEDLKEKYSKDEANKSGILNEMLSDSAKIQNIVDSILQSVKGIQNTVSTTISNIDNSVSYNDKRNVTYAVSDNVDMKYFMENATNKIAFGNYN